MQLAVVALQIAKMLGQVLLGLLISVVTGKAFKELLFIPLKKLALRLGNRDAEVVVEEARSDVGLPPDPELEQDINSQSNKETK